MTRQELMVLVERSSRALHEAQTGRDEAIRAASAAGVSYRAIAGVAGVSFQRVAQIVTNGKEER